MLRSTLAALFSACCALALPASAQQFTPDTVGVTKLGEFQRVYVSDPVLPHMVDGRIYVLDGADLKLKGMMESGFAGMLLLAPEKKRAYVASTFYERLTRGRRTDVIQVYDTDTLKVAAEIPIPTKRALALPYRNLFQRSADGRLIYIQNATPATSVTIVDLTRPRGFEVPSPGCYGIYPAIANPLRFATLCGDGSAATYTIAATRRSATRKAGAKFFDPDADALYTHAERDTDGYLFLSYKGRIIKLAVDDETARAVETIDVVSGVVGKWAPGGYQPIAFDAASGIAYVLMHGDAKEGSHKDPSTEIWAIDVRGKRLVARSPAKNLTSLTIGPGGAGVLFGIDTVDGKITRFVIDAKTRRVTPAGEVKLGETAALIEAPR